MREAVISFGPSVGSVQERAFRGLIFLNARGGMSLCQLRVVNSLQGLRLHRSFLWGPVGWRDAADRIGLRVYPTKVVGPRQTPGVELLLNGWSV